MIRRQRAFNATTHSEGMEVIRYGITTEAFSTAVGERP